MSWVRLDDHAPEHPKMLRAGPEACWLWVCGLAYCSRHLTDGEIPSEAVPLLGVPKAIGAVARLLKAGMWEETPFGYRVHDYHAYQPSKAQVTTRRERTAERVAAWKRTHGYACDNASGNGNGNAVTNPASPPSPSPSPDPVPKEPTYGTVFAAFWDAWPDGHRVTKKQAVEQWTRLSASDREAALTEVRWRVEHDATWQAPREDGRWAIPHPFRYLRDRRFTDARNNTPPAPVRAATAHPMPHGDADWCQHDPPCNSREWHAVKMQEKHA